MNFRGTVRLAPLALALIGCSVPIASGLEESDANRVVVALEANGIASDKETDPASEGHFRVSVARDDAAGAAQVLGQENLPPPRAPGVLDALGESSLVPSRSAEHAKIVAGTAGELERSLRGIEGVLAARVHLALPNKGPLETVSEKDPHPSASVLIRHRGSAPPLSAKDVQNLVAGAVTGLEPERVSVVMTPSAAPSRPASRELTRIGPITLARSSLTAFRALIVGVAFLNLVLIGLLLALWTRVRKTQAALEESRALAPTAQR